MSVMCQKYQEQHDSSTGDSFCRGKTEMWFNGGTIYTFLVEVTIYDTTYHPFTHIFVLQDDIFNAEIKRFMAYGRVHLKKLWETGTDLKRNEAWK